MPATLSVEDKDYKEALRIGRPPNIEHLFPNSKALIVSGRYIDRAMLAKGGAMTMAANGRNNLVIRGALAAAQKANAAIIIEIARSESNYCPVNLWNIARQVDAICNEMGITIPVAIHADHYTIKCEDDIAPAQVEIPSLFEHGITSIAVDASHLPDHQNLMANLALHPMVPAWAGLETEIGEIKGAWGLSNAQEALFLIQGLNAHDVMPDWIALNNGSIHGIESNGAGIQVELTAEIHEALSRYAVSGAQHGTSGNDSDRLRSIAQKTKTTKANVATALQMVAWGVAVNKYGNAILDDDGNLVKNKGEGVTEALWQEMTAYAQAHDLKSGDYKKLNLPFENKILGQPKKVRNRMVVQVEDFVHEMLVSVFNAQDTAPLVIDAILEAGSHDPGPKAARIEDPDNWTSQKSAARAALIDSDKGPEGDWDD